MKPRISPTTVKSVSGLIQRVSRSTILPVAILVISFGGCKPAEPDSQPEPVSQPEPAPAAAPQSDPENPVKISIADWDGIVEKMNAAEHYTIVDVWSLSCEPCKKEFPGLVKLATEYGDRLNCVSVNIDFDGRRTHPPEGYREEVGKFLEANQANFENYICSTPSDVMYDALAIESIPAVFIFDPQGKEVARFVDAGETRGFTYENNVAPKVAELLR